MAYKGRLFKDGQLIVTKAKTGGWTDEDPWEDGYQHVEIIPAGTAVIVLREGTTKFNLDGYRSIVGLYSIDGVSRIRKILIDKNITPENVSEVFILSPLDQEEPDSRS